MCQESQDDLLKMNNHFISVLVQMPSKNETKSQTVFDESVMQTKEYKIPQALINLLERQKGKKLYKCKTCVKVLNELISINTLLLTRKNEINIQTKQTLLLKSL